MSQELILKHIICGIALFCALEYLLVLISGARNSFNISQPKKDRVRLIITTVALFVAGVVVIYMVVKY